MKNIYFLIVILFATACGNSRSSKISSIANICPLTKNIVYFPGRCDNCDSNFDNSIEIYKTPLPALDPNSKKPSGWWADTSIYKACSNVAKIAGFSSGRVPLLRRIYEASIPTNTVILIDPSVVDDPPNYQDPTSGKIAKSGVRIINDWLKAGIHRKFYFAYMPSSSGHADYTKKDNYDSEVRSRVTICKKSRSDFIDGIKHVGFANALGPNFLKNPATINNLIECKPL